MTGKLCFLVEPLAKSHFESVRGSHGWDHVQRVLKLCEHIGPLEGCDMTVLRLAALLHDIGRNESDAGGGETCHAQLGAEMARGILKEAGADEALIGAVAHCVETHRFRRGAVPVSMEAKVLFDADKLDGIGAVGIGRAFLFAGEIGAMLHDPDVDIEKTESYTEDDTAYREYLVKLRHVKDRMQTKTGKAMAEERHSFMELFFGRLNAETRGEL
ncbi:MAG: HD domain-containing protein [Nitrospinae bacterium]|nr:HD domain-containing protein [Nitrospinota bacterium]